MVVGNAAHVAPASVRPAHDEIEELVTEMHALHVVALSHFLDGVRVLDASRTWKADGCRSTADYLVARFGMAFATSVRMVRLARRLGELPALAAAMAEGKLTLDVIEVVARMATPDTDALLTEQALGWTAAEARAAAAKERPVTKDDDEARQWAASFTSWIDDESGMVKFSGALPAEEGAALLAAIDREEAKVPTDPGSGVYQPITIRRAMALSNLVSGRLARDADADRATVVMYAKHDDFHAATGQGELSIGLGVSKTTLELLSCDCYAQTVVIDADGHPIGIGRKSKNVPRWLRRQVKKRDDGFCQFPGCDSRRFLDCHHIVHWANGGSTDLDNLVLLCRFHHRWLHRSGWSLEPKRVGRGFEVITPVGKVYVPAEPGLAPSVRERVLGTAPPPGLAAVAA